MQNVEPVAVCKVCGASVAEKYCGQCGQLQIIKRITFKSLLHDVFHLFTHLDKGIGYTLKRLLVTPGAMQREYVEGDRARHQKPFSMFFICATLAALSRYWVFLGASHYHDLGGLENEAHFFHSYLVLIHVVMSPIYALILYIFFYRSKYNYAEVGVLLLYTFSFFFLIVSLTSLLRLIWPLLETDYVELPFIAVYNAITFVNFFLEEKKWIVVLKSLIAIALVFLVANLCEDAVRHFLS